jgi:hypothetical protein
MRMAGEVGDPGQQFTAAWQAAAAALGAWRKQVAAATDEALTKLDPAFRAAVEAGRSALSGDWRNCRCQCGTAHPDDAGVCDGRAVMTRRMSGTTVPLCAPCAVAQGVAEMPH